MQAPDGQVAAPADKMADSSNAPDVAAQQQDDPRDTPGNDRVDRPADDSAINALRQAMAKMQFEHECAMSDLLRRMNEATTAPVPVVVQAPQLPRLRLLTGLPPINQQEATYDDLRAQAACIADDATIHDPAAYIRRSLRGVARTQCDTIKSSDAKAILAHLGSLFGVLKTPEDLYLDLCQIRQGRNQTTADLLTLQCDKLQNIRKMAEYSDKEFHRRLFSVFTRACTDDNLCRELRSRFGLPGEAAPRFVEVLQYVRKIEDLEGPKQKRQYPAQPQPTMSQVHVVPNAQMEPGRRPAKTRYCYRCGLDGHLWARCENSANPTLVAERDRARRQADNQWRQRKGLPTLPLN
ncbi:hypothetical protein ACOMHN_008997 [Nucella lapillus]